MICWENSFLKILKIWRTAEQSLGPSGTSWGFSFKKQKQLKIGHSQRDLVLASKKQRKKSQKKNHPAIKNKTTVADLILDPGRPLRCRYLSFQKKER